MAMSRTYDLIDTNYSALSKHELYQYYKYAQGQYIMGMTSIYNSS